MKLLDDTDEAAEYLTALEFVADDMKALVKQGLSRSIYWIYWDLNGQCKCIQLYLIKIKMGDYVLA